MLPKGIQVSVFLPYFLHSLGVIVFTLTLYHIILMLNFAGKSTKSLFVLFCFFFIYLNVWQTQIQTQIEKSRYENR